MKVIKDIQITMEGDGSVTKTYFPDNHVEYSVWTTHKGRMIIHIEYTNIETVEEELNRLGDLSRFALQNRLGKNVSV